MADLERTVLEYYQVQHPYPVEWPEEKNTSDVSDDEDVAESKLKRRKSRYLALERAVSRTNKVPGSETVTGAGGVGNLVQKDEPDPLGTTDSVVRTLKQYGLPMDDQKLRKSDSACGLLQSLWEREREREPY